jgi:hypothetical protein
MAFAAVQQLVETFHANQPHYLSADYQEAEVRRDFIDKFFVALGWGMNPRTRHARTLAFTYKHEDWIDALPAKTAATVRAIAGQFERGGTEGLENPQIFHTPEVKSAGGLAALQIAGNPRQLLIQTKTRMFAA